MGKVYKRHMIGEHYYICKTCGDTHLTLPCFLISKNFRGSLGEGWLFQHVVNVEFGEEEEKIFSTGCHVVRSVSCIECATILALSPDQKYKQEQILLESNLLMRKSQVLTGPERVIEKKIMDIAARNRLFIESIRDNDPDVYSSAEDVSSSSIELDLQAIDCLDHMDTLEDFLFVQPVQSWLP